MVTGAALRTGACLVPLTGVFRMAACLSPIPEPAAVALPAAPGPGLAHPASTVTAAMSKTEQAARRAGMVLTITAP
jgi:hypothetical protein